MIGSLFDELGDLSLSERIPRLCNAEGDIVGTAWLFNSTHALCAAHCIEAPGAAYSLKWYGDSVSARVREVHPELDFAVLELAERRSRYALPLGVLPKVPHWPNDIDWQGFGYARATDDTGLHLDGLVTAIDARIRPDPTAAPVPALQLSCAQGAHDALQGVSGCPVLVDERVVGMVRRAPPVLQQQVVFATRLACIGQALQDVQAEITEDEKLHASLVEKVARLSESAFLQLVVELELSPNIQVPATASRVRRAGYVLRLLTERGTARDIFDMWSSPPAMGHPKFEAPPVGGAPRSGSRPRRAAQPSSEPKAAPPPLYGSAPPLGAPPTPLGAPPASGAPPPLAAPPPFGGSSQDAPMSYGHRRAASVRLRARLNVESSPKRVQLMDVSRALESREDVRHRLMRASLAILGAGVRVGRALDADQVAQSADRVRTFVSRTRLLLVFVAIVAGVFGSIGGPRVLALAALALIGASLGVSVVAVHAQRVLDIKLHGLEAMPRHTAAWGTAGLTVGYLLGQSTKASAISTALSAVTLGLTVGLAFPLLPVEVRCNRYDRYQACVAWEGMASTRQEKITLASTLYDACLDGNAEACLRSGKVFVEASASEQSIPAFERACRGGLADGCEGWASSERRIGRRARELRALDFGCKERHAVYACETIARYYETGSTAHGIEKNPRRSIAYLERACRSETDSACARLFWLGLAQRDQPNGVPIAVRAYDALCARGHRKGCYSLGAVQWSRDTAAARDAFARGCELGDPRACHRYGELLENEHAASDRVLRAYERACHLPNAYDEEDVELHGHSCERLRELERIRALEHMGTPDMPSP